MPRGVLLAAAGLLLLVGAASASIPNCDVSDATYFEEPCGCFTLSCGECAPNCGVDATEANSTVCAEPSCSARTCCSSCYVLKDYCFACAADYVRSADWFSCLPTKCSQSPCTPNALCEDLSPGYNCTVCATGYYGDANVQCHACNCANGDCDSATGECACNAGWSGDACDAPICGDGVILGAEQCDVGADAEGDCCSSTCQFEAQGTTCLTGDGDVCTHDQCNSTGACAFFPPTGLCYCGNNVTDTGEDCDEGGVAPAPCAYGAQSCTVCGASCAFVPGATSFCGDLVVDTAHGEACDDGNTAGGDGCDASCAIEYRWLCPSSGGACSMVPQATPTSLSGISPQSWRADAVGTTFSLADGFPSYVSWVSLVPEGGPCTAGALFVYNVSQLTVAAPFTSAGSYDVCLSADGKASWARQTAFKLLVRPAAALPNSIEALFPASVTASASVNVLAVTGGMPSAESVVAFALNSSCVGIPAERHHPLRTSQLSAGPFAVGGVYATCYSTNNGTSFVLQGVTLSVFPPAATAGTVMGIQPNRTEAARDFALTLSGAVPSPDTRYAILPDGAVGCDAAAFVRSDAYTAHARTVVAIAGCGEYAVCLSADGGESWARQAEPLLTVYAPAPTNATVHQLVPQSVTQNASAVFSLVGALPSSLTCFAFSSSATCSPRFQETRLVLGTASLTAAETAALPAGALSLCLSTDNGTTWVAQTAAGAALTVLAAATNDDTDEGDDIVTESVDMTAVIAGSAAGGVVAIILIVLLSVLIHRRRRMLSQLRVLVDSSPSTGDVFEQANDLYEPKNCYKAKMGEPFEEGGMEMTAIDLTAFGEE